MPDAEPTPKTPKLNLSLDLRIISAILLAIIVVMLVLWKPWNGVSQSDRTVSVTGTAKLKAEPDLFLFVPSYDFKNADKDAALAQVTAKSNEVVAGLKELGVEDKDIKNNSNGYEALSYPEKDGGDETTYQLNLTVTVASREMAQKVQDYLITTSPSGQITPQGQFSDAKQKELQDKAREEASKDARTKAEKSAQQLGYRLGSVKSVQDGSGFEGPIPYEGRAIPLDAATTGPLTLQPGQDEVYYSVTVVYFVR